MELATTDRRSIYDRVTAHMRRGEFALGDVLALDTMVEPCLQALGRRSAKALPETPIPLRSLGSVTTFVTELEDAVRETAGSTFERELAEIAQQLKAKAVERSLSAAQREPVDEVDVVIERWLGRIAQNDPATAAHCRAVGAWANRIGARLSLDRDEIAFITRCGIIHDIGKVQTPKEILLASRRLSDDEWATMQKHTLDGWKIVSETRELREFGPVVRGHHERFDGRGYPDRLSKEQLTLATRIVTVADSFNAMIADRPYRPPMSPMMAIEELQRHRAKQFDPDCVDAMIDVVLAKL